MKRDLFEQVKKEKQLMLEAIEAQAARARATEEEEEVRRIREQSVFKATPIKHYTINLGKVSPKKLTQPCGPTLQTAQRAHLRDED
jgi:hypothetical protein